MPIYDEGPDLYLVEYFHGRQVRTLVTHEASVVDDWVAAHLPGEHLIAVATKPFRHGRGLALIQVCINNRCLIYQSCHANGVIPMSLRIMFENPNYTVVGVSMNKTRERLYRRYHLVIPNPVELGDWVHPRIRNGTLKSLAMRVMGLRYHVPRNIRRSRWWKIGLGKRQVLYATLDVFVTQLVASADGLQA